MFQKQMFKVFFETPSEQLSSRGEGEFACCRFAFGADVGMAECGDRNVGVVGGCDEASDHDFFFEGEFAVREDLAPVDADIAESAAGFLVAAGVEDDVLAVAFPPEGRTVRDVAVVGGEGGVDVVEGERGILQVLFRTVWIPSRWSRMTYGRGLLLCFTSYFRLPTSYFNHRADVAENMRSRVLE